MAEIQEGDILLIAVGMVLLGGWLDLIILEIFSNLWFCDSNQLK